MMNTEPSKHDQAVDVLVDLAMEFEIADPIDWEDMEVDEKTAFKMMASSVVEQFEDMPEEQHLTVAMATIVKLLVENFMMNVKYARK